MNYYERHLGDYAKQTGHLSMLQHGAYTLLLDRYYGSEKGIPAAKVYAVAKATSKPERAAVDSVLDEFFKLVDGLWIKNRCEEEIDRARLRVETARQNGRNGGRPKKQEQKPGGFSGGGDTETQHEPNGLSPEKPGGLFLGSQNETQSKALQTPDSRHQSPKEKKPPVSPLSTRGKALADARATHGLDVNAFDRWIGYRAERKPALKPVSFKAAAEGLAKYGDSQAAVVQQSIADGYQGLFPLKINGSKQHTAAPVRYRTADEIEAEERARGDYDAQH